ncbi:LuxR C-terminal-related transcriptional regulator [Streptomyces anulatus]|uniref:helix-turn-helix transcriptional regulator n=1 Tax=Streptomyces anulatus TaxID=1892 RepID=UPI00340D8058
MNRFSLSTGPARIAADIGSLATAPLREVALRLHTVLKEVWPHSALVIFTEDCTGRPQKKAGDAEITGHVTIAELDALRRSANGTQWAGHAAFGGHPRAVVTLQADTGAILVLCEPREVVDENAAAYARTLWEIVAASIARQVTEAAPDYLRESRAVSSERLQVTAELTDRHVADLGSLLATLRSRDLDHSRARALATDLAADALIRARTGGDLVASIAEEPVSHAFQRLKKDLRPLSRSEALDIQFVEPPADGRALPGEVAHAARAIVRSTILLMHDQKAVTRVRVQWNCDGTHLLISMRDDGPGRLDRDLPALRQLVARATALGGRLDLEAIADWGSRVDVYMPLDRPDTSDQAVHAWDLAPRETEVLRLITAGRRNRQIAAHLGISENTVKFHTSQLYRKLGVTSRAAAATLATEAGLR